MSTNFKRSIDIDTLTKGSSDFIGGTFLLYPSSKTKIWQFLSSDLSRQSGSWSHLSSILTHCPSTLRGGQSKQIWGGEASLETLSGEAHLKKSPCIFVLWQELFLIYREEISISIQIYCVNMKGFWHDCSCKHFAKSGSQALPFPSTLASMILRFYLLIEVPSFAL